MTSHADAGHAPMLITEDPVEARRSMLLGVKLAIASEVMLFGALFAAYFVVRADSPSWPPPGLERPELLLPGLNTVLLVTSSVTMQMAVWAIGRDDRRRSLRWMAATLVLGTIFLFIQGSEFANNGFGLKNGVFGSTFYTITGFHGAHVFIGLVLIAIVANRARRGLISGSRHTAVEAASYYWHFVDAVWLFVIATLYVL